MITRKINWVSSIDSIYDKHLLELEKKLSDFYSSNPDYYGDIDFTSENWINEEEEGYREIVKHAKQSQAICEFGCGSANILKFFPELEMSYAGCDFSGKLMDINQSKFPMARFKVIDEPNVLPYGNGEFDFVFSVFVLEHSTKPWKLLDECNRILKPGGRLILLCPDFLSKGRCPSQRVGVSSGRAVEKLKKKQILDAVITLFDTRIRVPFFSKLFEYKIKRAPQFYINLDPIVFEDPFLPDVDAVYLTSNTEIVSYLSKDFHLDNNSLIMNKYITEKKLLFLSFKKIGIQV